MPTLPRPVELVVLASRSWTPTPRWETQVRPRPSPNFSLHQEGSRGEGVSSGEPSCFWSPPQRGPPSWGAHHCKAFTCSWLNYEAAHFWCIHVGCPTVGSAVKFVNCSKQIKNMKCFSSHASCCSFKHTAWLHSSMLVGFFQVYKFCCTPTH